MASYILFIIFGNCGFQSMGCDQVNLNLTPLSFVNLSGFKPQALTIFLKLSTSPLCGLTHKLAYGFLTSLLLNDNIDISKSNSYNQKFHLIAKLVHKCMCTVNFESFKNCFYVLNGCQCGFGFECFFFTSSDMKIFCIDIFGKNNV